MTFFLLLASRQQLADMHVFRTQLPQFDLSNKIPVIVIRKCEGAIQIGRDIPETELLLRPRNSLYTIDHVIHVFT